MARLLPQAGVLTMKMFIYGFVGLALAVVFRLTGLLG